MVREVMLFGKPPEVAAHSPMLKVMASGFLQSIDMVAHELGWTLDPKKTTKHEMAVATRASLAGRCHREWGPWPRNGSPGRAPSTASRSSPCVRTG